MAEFLIAIAAIVFLLLLYIAYLVGRHYEKVVWERKLADIRGEAVQASRRVLTGQFSEQLAPYLPGFPFSPSEARFIGKPVDFLIFRGMDEKRINEVVFVEVKSGKAGLNEQQRHLKQVILDGRVSWWEYRAPEGIGRKAD